MTAANKPDNVDPNKPQKTFIALLLLLLIFVGGLFVIFSNQGGGSWIPLFTWDPFRVFRGSPPIPQRDPEKIEKLGVKGGSRATRNLVRLLYSGKIHREDRELAFDVLSDIARPDDMQVLIDASRWYAQPNLNWKTPVIYVLGEVGGESACKALNHKFLEDSGEIAYRRDSDEFDMMSLVNAIREADCLTQEEINERLRRFIRDMWVSEKFMKPAIEALAAYGDEQALAMIRNGDTSRSFAISSDYNAKPAAMLKVYSRFFNDAGRPIFIRQLPFEEFSALGGSKRELLDVHLKTAVLWIGDMPDELVKPHGSWVASHFIRYARKIMQSQNSTWGVFPETFFDDWADKLPESLPEEKIEMLLNMLQEMESAYMRSRSQWESANMKVSYTH